MVSSDSSDSGSIYEQVKHRLAEGIGLDSHDVSGTNDNTPHPTVAGDHPSGRETHTHTSSGPGAGYRLFRHGGSGVDLPNADATARDVRGSAASRDPRGAPSDDDAGAPAWRESVAEAGRRLGHRVLHPFAGTHPAGDDDASADPAHTDTDTDTDRDRDRNRGRGRGRTANNNNNNDNNNNNNANRNTNSNSYNAKNDKIFPDGGEYVLKTGPLVAKVSSHPSQLHDQQKDRSSSSSSSSHERRPVREDVHRVKDAVQDTAEDLYLNARDEATHARNAAFERASQWRDALQGSMENVKNRVKEDVVPAATGAVERTAAKVGEAKDTVKEAARGTAEQVGHVAQEAAAGVKRGVQRAAHAVGDAGEALRERVQQGAAKGAETWEDVKEAAADTAGRAAEEAQQWRRRAGDVADEWTERVQDTAAHWKDRAKEATEDFKEQTKGKAEDWKRKAEDTAGEWTAQSQQKWGEWKEGAKRQGERLTERVMDVAGRGKEEELMDEDAWEDALLTARRMVQEAMERAKESYAAQAEQLDQLQQHWALRIKRREDLAASHARLERERQRRDMETQTDKVAHGVLRKGADVVVGAVHSMESVGKAAEEAVVHKVVDTGSHIVHGTTVVAHTVSTVLHTLYHILTSPYLLLPVLATLFVLLGMTALDRWSQKVPESKRGKRKGPEHVGTTATTATTQTTTKPSGPAAGTRGQHWKREEGRIRKIMEQRGGPRPVEMEEPVEPSAEVVPEVAPSVYPDEIISEEFIRKRVLGVSMEVEE